MFVFACAVPQKSTSIATWKLIKLFLYSFCAQHIFAPVIKMYALVKNTVSVWDIKAMKSIKFKSTS